VLPPPLCARGAVGSLGATAGASFYWLEATTRDRPPLPAALVCRRTSRLLCRARPQRTAACLHFARIKTIETKDSARPGAVTVTAEHYIPSSMTNQDRSLGGQLITIPSLRAAATETKYPFIVQLAVTADGLDFGLSRRIMAFHSARHIQPRHGHSAVPRGREGEAYYRWCFSDLVMAQSFVEQFGGKILQASITDPR